MADVETSPRENNAGLVKGWETPKGTSKALIYNWKKNGKLSMIAQILELCREYPMATLFITVLLGISSVPLVIFWSFATASFLLTFTGFLVVQGTIFTIALVWLSVVLFVVICLSIFVSCLLGVTWSAAVRYGIVHHAASLLDQYLPGVKPRLAQFFTIESPKRK